MANLFCSSFCPLIWLIFISALLQKDKGTHRLLGSLQDQAEPRRGFSFAQPLTVKGPQMLVDLKCDVAKILAVIFPLRKFL